MPNNRIQSLTVNGVTYDIVDNTSGYINAQYIENKTDYSIPVSRVGEIVVGETAIGTDSTNFPTSKAVVDYVDERVVQEIDAIDVGVIGIKANGTSLAVENGIVNIPVVGPNQSVGLMTDEYMENIFDSIPHNTSDLYNDSGFITSETDPTVPDWAKASTKPTYTATEVGALPDSTIITDEKLKTTQVSSDNATYYPIIGTNSSDALTKLYDTDFCYIKNSGNTTLRIGTQSVSSPRTGQIQLAYANYTTTIVPRNNGSFVTLTLPSTTGTLALTSDIPTVPTNISSFTNDSGYLTASDIASVMTYKGTKASYSALPSSGNTTGDVWHLTDTGAEWAWDGSAWQELGTAIDLSGYVPAISEGPEQTYIPRIKIDNVDGALTIQGQVINSGTYEVMSSYGNKIYLSKSNLLLGAIGSTFDTANIRIITNNGGISTTIIRNLVTPTVDTDAANKKYVDDSVGALSIPTKTSDLTNDSGFLTSYTETDPTVPSWAKQSTKPSYALSEITSADDIKAIEALTGTSGLLRKTAANTWSLDTNTYLTSYTETDPTVPSWAKQSTKPSYTATEVGALPASTTIPSKTSDLTNDSGFITGYTETDPVFSASAAAGITSTDISNWNAKVSDDKTWNGVTFSRTFLSSATFYAPILSESTSTQSNLVRVTATPTANAITKYDGNKYLISTTPSANDNSTKVATTAYVDAAIPDTSNFLTIATLPIYDGTVV